ncbi:MAG: hypothetical protein J6W40_02255 [Alphaproteobacteria bacterium]|nr:hypothetical protein [Alphaproteobacteria bacterium]
MVRYTLTQQEALAKLAALPAGAERAKLLSISSIRNAVLNSGANVTFYVGDVNPKAHTVMDSLKGVYIGLIQRKNRKGALDGLGALGGLAERTKRADFDTMSDAERMSLVGTRDDIVIVDGAPTLLTDINEIRVNNVMREMREELGDLGITDITINPQELVLIPMPKVKDDNYLINKWNGVGVAFAVSPYCHICKDTRGIIDSIIAGAAEKTGGEAKEFKRVSLIDALTSWGNRESNPDFALEDGRSATRDYRYPHEYLVSWALASMLLEYNPQKMKQLASEVQTICDHLISFAEIARATKQTMKDVADILNVPLSVLQEMEKSCATIFKKRLAQKALGTTR